MHTEIFLLNNYAEEHFRYPSAFPIMATQPLDTVNNQISFSSSTIQNGSDEKLKEEVKEEIEFVDGHDPFLVDHFDPNDPDDPQVGPLLFRFRPPC